VQDEIELVVQVNGKLRGHIRVPATATREQIEAAAIATRPWRSSSRAEAEEGVVVPGGW
jgi:leucyl-tRNA synthetase